MELCRSLISGMDITSRDFCFIYFHMYSGLLNPHTSRGARVKCYSVALSVPGP